MSTTLSATLLWRRRGTAPAGEPERGVRGNVDAGLISKLCFRQKLGDSCRKGDDKNAGREEAGWCQTMRRRLGAVSTFSHRSGSTFYMSTFKRVPFMCRSTLLFLAGVGARGGGGGSEDRRCSWHFTLWLQCLDSVSIFDSQLQHRAFCAQESLPESVQEEVQTEAEAASAVVPPVHPDRLAALRAAAGDVCAFPIAGRSCAPPQR